MNHTLEEHKFFPVIAWGVSIAFACFVGFLALELKSVSEEMSQSSGSIEDRLERLEREIGIRSEETPTTE